MRTRVDYLVFVFSLSIACTASKSISSPDLSTAGGGGGAGGSGGSAGSGGSGGSAGSGGSPQDLAMATANDLATVCSGSADCPNATPVCCDRITLNGGTIPNCSTSAVKTDCETSQMCATQLNATCSGSQVVRLCRANSDCTEPSYNQCCAFTSGGSTIHFCATSGLATLGGGTCM